ncbi:MAG: hypothetical protein WAL90_13965 [Desulfobacterales bacterium]
MNPLQKERLQSRRTWALHAECIKLSGKSDVFNATSIKHAGNTMVLVSRKACKPGTNIIVRMLDFPPATGDEDGPRIRGMGLAEVRWIEEIMDEDGLAYEMGMRYVYTD